MSMFDGLSGQVGGQAKMKSLADQVDLSPSSESPVPDWARRTVRMVFTAWARSQLGFEVLDQRRGLARQLGG